MYNRFFISSLCIIIALGLAIDLSANTLPLFFKWQQANVTEYYPQRDDKKMTWSDFYKWHMGIDTTLVIPINIHITLTQQADFLEDQVVLENAIFTYKEPGNHYDLRISAENYGYGIGWMLHQRRNEDPLNDHNDLFEYRWYGATLGIPASIGHFNLAYGGNKFNSGMGYFDFKRASAHNETTFYVFEVGRDEKWNLNSIYAGVDTRFHHEYLSSRHAFQYEKSYPSTYYKRHDTLKYLQETWYEVNELHKFTLSIEATNLDQKNEFWQAELLWQYHRSSWRFDSSARYGEVQKDSFWKPSIQISFKPITYCEIGLYYEVVLTDQTRTTNRFGFQTTFNYPL
jgi:hypothetical protein